MNAPRRGIADLVVAVQEVRRMVGHVEIMATNDSGDVEEFEVEEIMDAVLLELRCLRAKVK